MYDDKAKEVLLSLEEIEILNRLVNKIKDDLESKGYRDDQYIKELLDITKMINKSEIIEESGIKKVRLSVGEIYKFYKSANNLIRNLKNEKYKSIDQLYINGLGARTQMIFKIIYRFLAEEIAKPIIDDINKKFGISYNIEILLGKNEIEREFEEVPDIYSDEAATIYKHKGKLYILLGETYNLLSSYTYTKKNEKINSEDLSDYQHKEVPLPYTLVHEYLHEILQEKLPKLIVYL
ncbi:hypothetical protein YN1_8460 [Nanoarchaeota archaeon]